MIMMIRVTHVNDPFELLKSSLSPKVLFLKNTFKSKEKQKGFFF